jgi:DNA adenine methylase
MKLKPLFIWAGGKTKVLKHYARFMPTAFETYYEPFFGGGAMFIHVMNTYRPKNVVINDINSDVINIYKAIKTDLDEFQQRLDSLESQYLPLTIEDDPGYKSKDEEIRKKYKDWRLWHPCRRRFYFEVRHQHAFEYQKWSKPYEAATLYFLMKTGFNGIYQLNQNTNGRYGTPAGLLNQKDKVYDRDVLKWWHDALQNVTIKSGDWKDAVENDPNGFFFFDPPYRDSFADYGNGFGDDALTSLLDFADAQNLVFVANRADDNWFDDQSRSMQVHYFDITYTAGRRKKTEDGFAAKKAREILLYKTDRVVMG